EHTFIFHQRLSRAPAPPVAHLQGAHEVVQLDGEEHLLPGAQLPIRRTRQSDLNARNERLVALHEAERVPAVRRSGPRLRGGGANLSAECTVEDVPQPGRTVVAKVIVELGD